MTSRGKRSTVERRWTAHGLECVVLWHATGYSLDGAGGHRCGYVNVPEGHPWHRVAYNAPAEDAYVDNSEFTTGDVGIIPAFCFGMADDETREEYNRRPEYQVRVHGGLTYSNTQPHDDCPSGWWFGFDCAHGDDTAAEWTEERVVAETECLAEQLAGVVPAGAR